MARAKRREKYRPKGIVANAVSDEDLATWLAHKPSFWHRMPFALRNASLQQIYVDFLSCKSRGHNKDNWGLYRRFILILFFKTYQLYNPQHERIQKAACRDLAVLIQSTSSSVVQANLRSWITMGRRWHNLSQTYGAGILIEIPADVGDSLFDYLPNELGPSDDLVRLLSIQVRRNATALAEKLLIDCIHLPNLRRADEMQTTFVELFRIKTSSPVDGQHDEALTQPRVKRLRVPENRPSQTTPISDPCTAIVPEDITRLYHEIQSNCKRIRHLLRSPVSQSLIVPFIGSGWADEQDLDEVHLSQALASRSMAMEYTKFTTDQSLGNRVEDLVWNPAAAYLPAEGIQEFLLKHPTGNPSSVADYVQMGIKMLVLEKHLASPVASLVTFRSHWRLSVLEINKLHSLAELLRADDEYQQCLNAGAHSWAQECIREYEQTQSSPSLTRDRLVWRSGSKIRQLQEVARMVEGFQDHVVGFSPFATAPFRESFEDATMGVQCVEVLKASVIGFSPFASDSLGENCSDADKELVGYTGPVSDSSCEDYEMSLQHLEY